MTKKAKISNKSNSKWSLDILLLVCYIYFFSVECSLGFFGVKCKENCSRYCFNNESCDHISGVCKQGCIDGYTGTHCNQCKKNITHKVMKFICYIYRCTDDLV